MEKKIKIILIVMSLMLLSSALFCAIAFYGVLSFTTGMIVFASVQTIRKFIGMDERELYASIAMFLFSLLASLSFVFVYLGIYHAQDVLYGSRLFSYSFVVFVFSSLLFFITLYIQGERE